MSNTYTLTKSRQYAVFLFQLGSPSSRDEIHTPDHKAVALLEWLGQVSQYRFVLPFELPAFRSYGTRLVFGLREGREEELRRRDSC